MLPGAPTRRSGCSSSRLPGLSPGCRSTSTGDDRARECVCVGADAHVPPVAVHPAAPGRGSGASLIVAAFSVRGVFTNPGTRGSYPWNGVFVPYTPGTATANAANCRAEHVVRPSPDATDDDGEAAAARPSAPSRSHRLRDRGRPGHPRHHRAVPRRRDCRGCQQAQRSEARTGRTNARGCVTRRIRVKRRSLYVRAIADVPARLAPGCQPTIVPRCTEASVAPGFDLSSGRAKRVRR